MDGLMGIRDATGRFHRAGQKHLADGGGAPARAVDLPLQSRCYECQLGELEVAKARLRHAFKLEAPYRLVALEDDNLQPLWDAF